MEAYTPLVIRIHKLVMLVIAVVVFFTAVIS